MKNRKVVMLCFGYYAVSILLYLFTKIDVLPACLFKSVFGVSCLGCGMTRAFIQLLYLNFLGAYQTNPMVFVVIPLLFYIVYQDFKKVDAMQLSD